MAKEIRLPRLLQEEIGERKKEKRARERAIKLAWPFYLDCQKFLKDNNYIRSSIEVKKDNNDFEIALFQDEDWNICFLYSSYSYHEKGRRFDTLTKIQLNARSALVFRRTPEENKSKPATLKDVKDFQELFNFFKGRLSEGKLEESNEDMPLILMEDGHHVPLDKIDDGF